MKNHTSLLYLLLPLIMAGCSSVNPAQQTLINPQTTTSTPPALQETASPRPPGLTVEEYALQSPPSTEPFSFTPLEGLAEDILSKHAGERGMGFADTSFFTDDGHYAWRVNLGTDTLTATENYSQTGSEGWVSVTRNGEEIYRIETGPASPYNALRGLWTYDDHWVLETASILSQPVDNNVATEPVGQITQDGELLNERLGFDAMFGFQMLAGRPLYFFKKDGKIGYAYDGQVVEAGYDEIPHYNCCSAGALNPRIAQNMIAFFARRGEQWSYVEIGVYPSQAPTPISGGSLFITPA